MFWALWQQNFSSWVIQADKMNRHLFGIEWKPAQIQTVNPIFILVMLPTFSYAIYPAIERVFRLTPLRKFGMGLFVTAFAFLIISWIQARIDAETRHKPSRHDESCSQRAGRLVSSMVGLPLDTDVGRGPTLGSYRPSRPPRTSQLFHRQKFVISTG